MPAVARRPRRAHAEANFALVDVISQTQDVVREVKGPSLHLGENGKEKPTRWEGAKLTQYFNTTSSRNGAARAPDETPQSQGPSLEGPGSTCIQSHVLRGDERTPRRVLTTGRREVTNGILESISEVPTAALKFPRFRRRSLLPVELIRQQQSETKERSEECPHRSTAHPSGTREITLACYATPPWLRLMPGA